MTPVTVSALTIGRSLCSLEMWLESSPLFSHQITSTSIQPCLTNWKVCYNRSRSEALIACNLANSSPGLVAGMYLSTVLTCVLRMCSTI